jgi:hypothetical protein
MLTVCKRREGKEREGRLTERERGYSQAVEKREREREEREIFYYGLL